jgi:hypothetical protein
VTRAIRDSPSTIEKGRKSSRQTILSFFVYSPWNSIKLKIFKVSKRFWNPRFGCTADFRVAAIHFVDSSAVVDHSRPTCESFPAHRALGESQATERNLVWLPSPVTHLVTLQVHGVGQCLAALTALEWLQSVKSGGQTFSPVWVRTCLFSPVLPERVFLQPSYGHWCFPSDLQCLVEHKYSSFLFLDWDAERRISTRIDSGVSFLLSRARDTMEYIARKSCGLGTAVAHTEDRCGGIPTDNAMDCIIC